MEKTQPLKDKFPSFFRKSKVPVTWELHYEDPELGCNSLLVDSHCKYLDYVSDYKSGIFAITTHYEDSTSETTVRDYYE